MQRRNFLQWLSLSGLTLTTNACKKDKSIAPIERISTNTLIIGSGFGGSVSALRLAEAGIENILVERGRSWTNHDFCSFARLDERSTWLNNQAKIPIINMKIPIKKYSGVIEYHTYPNMNVFNASGVGGGSLVFGATFVKPDKEIFERIFPSEVDFDELSARFYSKVEQEIGFSHIPEDIYNSKYYLYARTFKEQVINAGKTTKRLPAAYDWNIIREELDGTIAKEFLIGDGNYGTRNGSKYSLDKTYIPKAIATGKTTLLSLHQVINISIRKDNKYEVELDALDETGRVIQNKIIVCEKLFLCAGCPNTIKLLLKAKATSNLTSLNDRIGKGFGTNGKTFFRRTIPHETGSFTGWTPAEANAHYDNPHVPILIENIPQPIGLILPGPDLKSHFHVGLGATTYRGKYSYNPEEDLLELDWDKHGLDESISAAKHWCEEVNAANPGTYVDDVLIKERFANNLTYHPLGGCVLGEATDFYGRLKEYPHLYVNDSSLIPGVAACANPAFTIAAMAERNIAKILEEDF